MRGDHGEVVRLLVDKGAKMFQDGQLIDYQSSPLSGYIPCQPKRPSLSTKTPLSPLQNTPLASPISPIGHWSLPEHQQSSHCLFACPILTSTVLGCRYVRVYDKLQLQPEYEIDPAELELLSKVGEGEFGSVHLGRWNKTIVAIKVLRRSDAVALGDFRCAFHKGPRPM